MRRTVVLALALAFIAGSAFIVAGQKKVVDASKLQALLPTAAPAGFKVDEPASGAIESTPLGRVARAGIGYKTSGEVPRTIHVAIVDCAEIMTAQMSMLEITRAEAEQSEGGYQKPVVIKGKYRGREKSQQMPARSMEVAFVVGDRFIVTVSGTYLDDVKILYSLIDAMSVESLEKVT